MKTVLVTGGAGYIGSHTVLCLLQAGFHVVVLDNLANSNIISLHQIKKICGVSPVFINGDVRNKQLLDDVISQYNFSSVLHFAGLKSVGESTLCPLQYYENNFCGSKNLLESMNKFGVFNLVFSSSATVYGSAQPAPLREDGSIVAPTNPYGHSKLMVEQLLKDVASSDERWAFGILRYFNPVGAHRSGLIGENPRGIPNNLLPYICRVAAGKHENLTIFGNDYPTRDGTGIRDYVHVMDLADGHLKALQALQSRSGAHVWNLGTGLGYSVLEILQAFERASGKQIPYAFAPRRAGDVAESWADPSKAKNDLGWAPLNNLEQMMIDTWNWQMRNPGNL